MREEDEAVEAVRVFGLIGFDRIEDRVAGNVIFVFRRGVVGVRAGAGREIYECKAETFCPVGDRLVVPGLLARAVAKARRSLAPLLVRR